MYKAECIFWVYPPSKMIESFINISVVSWILLSRRHAKFQTLCDMLNILQTLCKYLFDNIMHIPKKQNVARFLFKSYLNRSCFDKGQNSIECKKAPATLIFFAREVTRHERVTLVNCSPTRKLSCRSFFKNNYQEIC